MSRSGSDVSSPSVVLFYETGSPAAMADLKLTLPNDGLELLISLPLPPKWDSRGRPSHAAITHGSILLLRVP